MKNRLISGGIFFLVILLCLFGKCQAQKPRACKCKYEQKELVAYLETKKRTYLDVPGTLTITKDNDIYIRITSLQLQINFKYDTCIEYGSQKIYRIESKKWTGYLTVRKEFAKLDIWEKEKKAVYLAMLVFKDERL